MATYAERLFYTAKEYNDHKAKARTLKQAQNAAYTENNYELVKEIERYALSCGIDFPVHPNGKRDVEALRKETEGFVTV